MTESLNPTLQRLLHNLADAILHQANKTQPHKPGFDLLYGIVTAINTTDHTLSVKLAGDPSTSSGVSYVGTYAPTVGDLVAVIHHNHDLLVIGAPAPDGLPTPSSGFPIADTTDYVGPVAGTDSINSNPMEVAEFSAGATIMAAKVAGDAYPRIAITVEPTFTFLAIGDGTYDPLNFGATFAFFTGNGTNAPNAEVVMGVNGPLSGGGHGGVVMGSASGGIFYVGSSGLGFFNKRGSPAGQQASGGTLAGVIAGLVALGLFSS